MSVSMTRVALVTGAGRGIGRSIAVALARTGWDVAVTSRSGDQLAETAALVGPTGRKVLAVTGDVTRSEDVDRVCEQTQSKLGPVDLLVNNAGDAGIAGAFAGADTERWWRVVETNVRGPALYCATLLPGMIERRRGQIININSMQGSKVSGASSAYGVSKAALMRFTDALAGELVGTGVEVIDFSPGLVRTTMTSGRPDLDALPPDAWNTAEAAAGMVATLASGRYRGLSGRFVRLTDDLDALAAELAGDPDRRVLRLRK